MKKKPSRSVENLKFNNELVVQQNNLIEARYRLSLQEKRLMLFVLSNIKANDDSFRNITTSIYELANLIGLEGNSVHKEMEKVTKNMVGRVLSVRDLDKNTLLQVPWVASAEYFYNEGIIKIQISEKLAPYLLKLKGEFTITRLSDLMKFKSFYAIRIYEMLKQYENLGTRKIDLSDLRLSCGIPDNRLKLVSDLRIHVLEMAKKEINEKSDIFIDYEFIKRSRSFVSIEFSIKKNPNYDKITEIKQIEGKTKKIQSELRTRDKLIEDIEYRFKLKKRSFMTLITPLTDLEIENAIRAVRNQTETNTVENPSGMMITALKEKWRLDVFNPSKLKKVN